MIQSHSWLIVRGLFILLIITGVSVAVWWYLPYKMRAELAAFRHLPQKETSARLESIIARQGADAAWQFLKIAYLSSDGSLQPAANDPHSLAHMAGAAFYKEYGLSGITRCDEQLTYGCFHGFVGEAVQHKGLAEIPNIVTACEKNPRPIRCSHGIGHGIYETENDLATSITACETMVPDDAIHCVEGVVMENSWHIPQSIRTQSPWYPCDVIAPRYRPSCATSKPNYLSAQNKTATEIGAFCNTAETKDMRTECIFSLGSVVERTSEGKKSAILDQCSQLKHDDKDQCVLGAIYLLASRRDRDWQTTVKELCSNISQKLQDQCALKGRVDGKPLISSSR